jgi:hypothetical protein
MMSLRFKQLAASVEAVLIAGAVVILAVGYVVSRFMVASPN